MSCASVNALEFEPGVGLGVEYTDNVRLTPDEIESIDDVITVGYVSARIAENEGPLQYSASTSLNKQTYTQDTFADQSYLNLSANARWAMIKDRFNWTLSDTFSQRAVNSLDSNTPDNLQDSNVFTLGANIQFRPSARQQFSLSPTFSQYYYEQQLTDNKQYALAANWNYQMFRLNSVGLNLSARKLNYSEQENADLTFTTLAVVFSGQRPRSGYSINAGSTTVSRDVGEDTTGFSGSLNWRLDLTSRSKITTRISYDLTDSSSSTLRAEDDPAIGSLDNVQITTDVVRNSVFNLTYLRDDASLQSSIWAEHRKLTYEGSPFDRVIQVLGVRLSYPVTALLSSSLYTSFNRTEQLDDSRIDELFIGGGNLKYNFSRKIHGLFDLKYRTKDSPNFFEQNYEEVSLFASLVYGFGGVSRPSGTGGF